MQRKRTIKFNALKNKSTWGKSEFERCQLTYTRAAQEIDVRQVLSDVDRLQLLPLDAEYQRKRAKKIACLGTVAAHEIDENTEGDLEPAYSDVRVVQLQNLEELMPHFPDNEFQLLRKIANIDIEIIKKIRANEPDREKLLFGLCPELVSLVNQKKNKVYITVGRNCRN